MGKGSQVVRFDSCGEDSSGTLGDVLCLSHLRWDFVFQRPQHLMTRCARGRRVFFVEEPVFDAKSSMLDISTRPEGVHVVVPRLPPALAGNVHDQITAHSHLLNELVTQKPLKNLLLWYYTPVALAFTLSLLPDAVVYDCMDELSGFAGASTGLPFLERVLFRHADVVFTGGQSLYLAKKDFHSNIHAFPSSVDREHFAAARRSPADPEDQAPIPRPRAGFMGVIDERMDQDLLQKVAEAHPNVQFVMLGPVTKIDPARLPRRPNLWYLGPKSYRDLPSYLGGWDVAMMPFAHNEATKFISPTKTLEYLAAGLRVVSTSVRDVVEPYGSAGLVAVADTPAAFVAAIDAALAATDRDAWLSSVDAYLAAHSWDSTWSSMSELVSLAVARRKQAPLFRSSSSAS